MKEIYSMKKENIVLEIVPQYEIRKAKNSEVVAYRKNKEKLICSNKVSEFAHQFYGDDIEIYESFFIIVLSKSLIPKAWMKISQGGISGTVVDVKIIAKYAVEHLGSNIVLIHNHPSDTTIPSNADIKITKKVKEALKLFDIDVIDHVILTSDESRYYSFADEGMI